MEPEVTVLRPLTVCDASVAISPINTVVIQPGAYILKPLDFTDSLRWWVIEGTKWGMSLSGWEAAKKKGEVAELPPAMQRPKKPVAPETNLAPET